MSDHAKPVPSNLLSTWNEDWHYYLGRRNEKISLIQSTEVIQQVVEFILILD